MNRRYRDSLMLSVFGAVQGWSLVTTDKVAVARHLSTGCTIFARCNQDRIEVSNKVRNPALPGQPGSLHLHGSVSDKLKLVDYVDACVSYFTGVSNLTQLHERRTEWAKEHSRRLSRKFCPEHGEEIGIALTYMQPTFMVDIKSCPLSRLEDVTQEILTAWRKLT